MKKSIIKYLPDFLIIIGIALLSYNLFRPVEEQGPFSLSLTNTENHTDYKVLGVVMVAIGIDIAVRRIMKKQ